MAYPVAWQPARLAPQAGVAHSDVRCAQSMLGARGFGLPLGGLVPEAGGRSSRPGLAHFGPLRAAAAWSGLLREPWPRHHLEVRSRVSPFHALRPPRPWASPRLPSELVTRGFRLRRGGGRRAVCVCGGVLVVKHVTFTRQFSA